MNGRCLNAYLSWPLLPCPRLAAFQCSATVGTAELAGAISLLTPWLAGLAAAGLAADMAGATIINATVLHDTTYGVNVWMTALLCAVFVLLAHHRRQQIKGLAAAIRRQRGARAAASTRRTRDPQLS